MSASASGVLSICQFGRESAYGNAVAATHKLGGFISFNAKPSYAAQLLDPSLDGSLFTTAILNIGQFVEWTLSGVVDYSGLTMLYDLVYGTDTYGANGGTTVGGSPNVHTFVGRKNLNSYTFQLGIGDVPTSKVRRMVGAKALKLEFSVTAGGGESAAMRFTISGVGSLLADTITPTAGLNTFTRVPIYFTHMDTAVSLDGTGDIAGDMVFTEFGFSIENGVASQRFQLGVPNLREPIRDGKIVEKMTIKRDHVTETLLQTWLAGTDLAPSFKFKSGTD